MTPTIRRLFSRTLVGDGCWTWQGSGPDGYGTISVNNRSTLVHRLSYEHFVGPIPAGLVLDHKCRNRKCLRPDHLEPVTDFENQARGAGRKATALRTGKCFRGHDFDRVKKDGGRECSKCKRIRDRNRKRRTGVTK